MPGLPASQLLDLWEQGEQASAIDRAVMLACAASRTGAADVADLPLGERDARLLELHAQLSERGLEATAECPACAERVEFAVDADALLAGAPAAAPPAPVEADGIVVQWRPPSSRDLAAATVGGSPDATLALLLERCVESASGPDGAVAAEALPPAAREAVAEAMAAADPLAELRLNLSCPACGHTFMTDLDVAEFAWTELRNHARRLLREIDVLARAYGWTEPQVLALGARRRAAYLELALEAT